MAARWAGLLLLCLMVLSGTPAGAAMDQRTIPYLSGQSRLEVARDYALAAANQSAYTLAVSSGGSWDSMSDPRESPAERARDVLQRCEHRAKMRCLLVYENGQATGEKVPRPSVISYPDTFDPAVVPFLPTEVLAVVGPRFANGQPHRALRDPLILDG